MRLIYLQMIALLSLTTLIASASPNPPAQAQIEGQSSRLSYSDSIILGLVEGVTEFLPVSSTGHLILTNALLGLDGDTPIRNKNGEFITVVDRESGVERYYTSGEASYAYVIVIQAGAIAAVIMLYWKSILAICLGCLGKNPDGRKLAVNLIFAFIPAAIIGLLLDDFIESALGDNVHAVGAALIAGAFLMLGIENWRKKRIKRNQAEIGLSDLTIKQSIAIGLFQCVAMWPGTSRSMMTIVGGYFAGLSPKHAAEFSFLLGLITLTAASGYKTVSDGANMITALEIGPVLLGCSVAFASAAVAVRWMVGYLSAHGLTLFAWYRIALALAILAF